MMRLNVPQPGTSLHGRQIYLPLLLILVSHVLLMMTPLHDVLLLGHRASDRVMAAHAVHAASG